MLFLITPFLPEYKKIVFGDNLNMQFSVVRKAFYAFLHHKEEIGISAC